MAARRPNLRTTLLPRLAGLTRVLPTPLMLRLRPVIAAALGAAPGWRPRLERSMTAALGRDGWDRRHVEEYFLHLADLLVFSLAVYHKGIRRAGLDREWTYDPLSRERFLEAMAEGKGALLVGGHLILHEIMTAMVTAELPVTALVRKSPDPEYAALKKRWADALGVETVYRPPSDSPVQGLAEMTAAVRALRRNRVLAMSADLLQRPGTGIPVRLFGKDAALPVGPFFLAARLGAPLMPSYFHKQEGRYLIWCHEAIRPDLSQELDRAMAEAAQVWAIQFEEFIRAHPDMWQFWLDKKWTRWLDS